MNAIRRTEREILASVGGVKAVRALPLEDRLMVGARIMTEVRGKLTPEFYEIAVRITRREGEKKNVCALAEMAGDRRTVDREWTKSLDKLANEGQFYGAVVQALQRRMVDLAKGYAAALMLDEVMHDEPESDHLTRLRTMDRFKEIAPPREVQEAAELAMRHYARVGRHDQVIEIGKRYVPESKILALSKMVYG